MTAHKQGRERVAASGRSPHPAGQDESPTPTQRLAHEAAEAAELRRYQTHPDVVALRVERVRTQVDRMCWAGIGLGLLFTMSNVQQFAAADATAWSLPWLAAWLLDPTVSLVLLAILRTEQVTARYQVHTGRCVRAAKWLALGSTYLMNTWASWAGGSAAAIVLHSVPPLMVFAAAEAVTDLRDKLTDAAVVACTDVATPASGPPPPVNTGVHGEPVHDAGRATPRGGTRRKLFADYLADARAAWTPDVTVTPAWVRKTTGCSRGLSSRIADTLTADIDTPSGEESAP